MLNLKNKGSSATYVRVVAKGIPSGIDSVSSSANLVMNVKYVDSANKTIDPISIQQGTDFRMIVTVKPSGKTC